jgi:hypothetical protein
MNSPLNKTSISIIVRKLKELMKIYAEVKLDEKLDREIIDLSSYLFSLLPPHKKLHFKKSIDRMMSMIEEIPRIEKECQFCIFARKGGRFTYYCSRSNMQTDKENGCENFLN